MFSKAEVRLPEILRLNGGEISECTPLGCDIM
jgi:hypothetical protein